MYVVVSICTVDTSSFSWRLNWPLVSSCVVLECAAMLPLQFVDHHVSIYADVLACHCLLRSPSIDGGADGQRPGKPRS